MGDDFEALGLLEGVADEKEREARIALLRELLEEGATVEELQRAVAENRLVLLPVELALSVGDERYTAQEVSERSGLALDFLEKFWRAQGRPRPEAGDRVFDEEDVQSAINVRLSREAGLPDDGILEIARVIGLGMANVAATTSRVFGEAFLRAGDTEYDLSRRYGEESRALLPLLEPALGHALRAHLRTVMQQVAVGGTERASGRLPGATEMSVAFADLTGFTRLGEMVPPEELGALAERFADLTADVVAPPVRLVKTIGDAVMLVSPEPDAIIETVLDLNDAADAEESGLPPIHAGVARGPALARAGDYYGSAVNQASRIAQFARSGSVVASQEVREASQNGYAWSFAGRRRLKGLAEPVNLFRVRRAEAEPPAETAPA